MFSFLMGCSASHPAPEDCAGEVAPPSVLPSDRACNGLRSPTCPDCYCWFEDADDLGYCLSAPDGGDPCEWTIDDCRIGIACLDQRMLCSDVGSTIRYSEARGVVCIYEEMCRRALRDGSRLRCYYEDGSMFESGTRAIEACHEHELGVLCGPGCGDCPVGGRCIGVSERSGLGLCVGCGEIGVADAPPPAPARPNPHCALGASCPSGSSCLGFVAPADGLVEPDEVAHRCAPTALCREIAARRPDRFRCLD